MSTIRSYRSFYAILYAKANPYKTKTKTTSISTKTTKTTTTMNNTTKTNKGQSKTEKKNEGKKKSNKDKIDFRNGLNFIISFG